MGWIYNDEGPSSRHMTITGNRGNHMSDTIELLEAIGRDALLRHASAEELTRLLEQAQASEALTTAVVSGDSSQLSKELGCGRMDPPQSSQGSVHEDDEPEHDDVDEPHHAPAPDQGKPPSR